MTPKQNQKKILRMQKPNKTLKMENKGQTRVYFLFEEKRGRGWDF